MIQRPCLLFILLALMGTVCVQASETVIHVGPVKIATSADRNIFPDRWQSSRIDAQAEPLTDRETERSKTILVAAFKKYPREILVANLDAVYVLHRLKFFGISAGGTNSKSRIYLANRGVSAGFTDTWVEGVFHAEFSSILLRNFSRHLDTDAWKAINRSGFEYGTSGVQAIRNGMAVKRFDAQLHDTGFLFEYAQSSLENDFNSIAEQLFTGDPRFWAVVRKHGGIRRKTELVVRFYQQLDPLFSRAYFESMTVRFDAEQSDAPELPENSKLKSSSPAATR